MKAVRASEAMAREAQGKGVRFMGGTKVTGIGISGGRVKEVITEKERIGADNVLICAGIWGPKVARMAGITLPLSPMEHLYTKTTPLEELRDETKEVVHPVLRHQDKSMYFREHGDSYGIGFLQPRAAFDRCRRYSPARKGTDNALDKRVHSPALHESQECCKRTHAGIEESRSRLQDKRHVLIHDRRVPNFRAVARCGRALDSWKRIGIMHSGGVGKVMAEWMVNGVPSLDLRECDVNRFHSYAFNVSYIKARAAQQDP